MFLFPPGLFLSSLLLTVFHSISSIIFQFKTRVLYPTNSRESDLCHFPDDGGGWDLRHCFILECQLAYLFYFPQYSSISLYFIIPIQFKPGVLYPADSRGSDLCLCFILECLLSHLANFEVQHQSFLYPN